MSLAGRWVCRIQALDESGRVIDERTTYNMLNTDNWGAFLAAMFTAVNIGGANNATMTDNTNTTYAFGMYQPSAISTAFNYTGPAGTGPYFQLGTGATAAARSDYVLQTPTAGTQSLSATYIAGSGVVSMGGTITYAANQTPGECGLYQNWHGTGEPILIDHQVFAPLAAAKTFTVAWTITLP